MLYKSYAEYYRLPITFPNIFSSQSNMEICKSHSNHKNKETQRSTRKFNNTDHIYVQLNSIQFSIIASGSPTGITYVDNEKMIILTPICVLDLVSFLISN